MKSKVAELVVEFSTTPFFMAVASATPTQRWMTDSSTRLGTEELFNLLAYKFVQILPLVEHGCEHEDSSETGCGFR